MKVATLAALTVLIAFPAEAGQRYRQNNVSPTCDNDGRCATLTVTAATSTIPTCTPHQSVTRTTLSMPMATA